MIKDLKLNFLWSNFALCMHNNLYVPRISQDHKIHDIHFFMGHQLPLRSKETISLLLAIFVGKSPVTRTRGQYLWKRLHVITWSWKGIKPVVLIAPIA